MIEQLGIKEIRDLFTTDELNKLKQEPKSELSRDLVLSKIGEHILGQIKSEMSSSNEGKSDLKSEMMQLEKSLSYFIFPQQFFKPEVLT